MSHIATLLFIIGACLCVSVINGLSINTLSNLRGAKVPNIFNSATDMFYQEYILQGDCKMESLISMELYPLYKPTDACVQTGPNEYMKTSCDGVQFEINQKCDSTCEKCYSKTTYPLFGCHKTGLGYSLRVCGKMPETIPKMLWKVQYEANNSTQCSESKLVKSVGNTAGVCEWSSINKPQLSVCNETDYSISKYTGSVKQCTDRINMIKGKVGVCEGNEEYLCQ